MTEPKPTYGNTADLIPAEMQHTNGATCWCKPTVIIRHDVTEYHHHDTKYWMEQYENLKMLDMED